MRKLLCIGGVLLTFFFGQAVDSAWTAARLVLTPNPRDANYGYGESKLFPVRSDGKAGYIDETGKIVIPLRFAFGGPFIEGLASVEEDGIRFFIDRFGNQVIAPGRQYRGT